MWLLYTESSFLSWFPRFEKWSEAYAITMLSVCLWITPYRFPNSRANSYVNWYVYHSMWAILNNLFRSSTHKSTCLFVYPTIKTVTPWYESSSELYQLSNHLFSAKLVPTLRRECVAWSMRRISTSVTRFCRPSMCILPLLNNGKVETLPLQQRSTQQYLNCWTRRFLCSPCIIKLN
jgi:hypothetical protein